MTVPVCVQGGSHMTFALCVDVASWDGGLCVQGWPHNESGLWIQ